MKKIISISNQKGGVGKTTTTINLATSLAAVKKNVLIVDADPQGNASTGLGISYDNRKPSIYEMIHEKKLLTEGIKDTLIPGLKIIGANTDLAAAEVELTNFENREFVLKSIFADIKNFDFIFVDCPPALGLLTINSLVASDTTLIPLQSEFFALEGLSALMQTIKLIQQNFNKNLKIEGILLTMLDKRNSLSSLDVSKPVLDLTLPSSNSTTVKGILLTLCLPAKPVSSLSTLISTNSISSSLSSSTTLFH